MTAPLCDRCGGKGIVDKVPGDHRVKVTCTRCNGTGRRVSR